MADLTITESNVVPGSGATFERGIGGESIAAGQTCYKSTSDKKWYLADADAAGEQDCKGIAVSACEADGAQVVIQKSGNVALGAILTKGTTYVLSDTAGGIMPIADLDSGDTVVLLGTATSTSNLLLHVKNTGAVV